MKKFVFKAISNSLALYLAAFLFPSITMNNLLTPVLAGLVLAVLCISLRPLLVLLLSPLVLLTAGLLTLIINTWMLMLTEAITGHMLDIPGFWLTAVVAMIAALFDLQTRSMAITGRITRKAADI